MGNEIDYYYFSKADANGLMKPIVFINPKEEILNRAICINVPMAKELKKQGIPVLRTMNMEQSLLNVLNTLEANPIIKGIDVMFNPDYQMDVIKILVNVYRRK